MNVNEMVRNVKGECHPITNLDTKIIRDLDRGQKIIYSKRNWSWGHLHGFSFNTIPTVDTYALSPLVDVSKLMVLTVPSYNRTLEFMTESMFQTQFIWSILSTGTPNIFRLNGFDPVQNQPIAVSLLEFVSDDATDITQVVRIQGLNLAGIMVSESVVLTGVVPVSSVNAYTRIFSLSKEVTAGAVTVTSDLGLVTNVIFAPNDTVLQHPRVSLYPIPDAALAINYDFYMRLPTLRNGQDISLIPEQYHDTIELYAKARMFAHQNKKQDESFAMQEFVARVEDMTRDDYQPSGLWSKDGFSAPIDTFTRTRILTGY